MTLDLRERQSSVKDQGRRGTCVAFAATGGHEMRRADDTDLAEEYLHWAAKQRDGLPKTEGTTLAAAASALADLGQPPEHIWPYDERRNQWASTYQPPAGAAEEATRRRWTGGQALDPTPTALRAALGQGSSVLLGIRLYATWHTSSGGHIAVPAAHAIALGGHAVLLAGFDDGVGEGAGHFIVRNSWGADWGDGGYGYVPYAYVEAHGLQAWALTV